MSNIQIRYGVIGGIISITLGLVNWFTISQWYGPTASQAVGYLSIIVSMMCVPLGIRYFRDHVNGGEITLGKAMRVGLGITGFFTLITFLYGILFFVFAGENFENWRREGLSAKELATLEAQIAQTPEIVFTPFIQGLILAISVFLIGVIVDLISALVLKRSL